MLAAERGSLNSSFGVQVASHRGCNEQDQSSQTGTSLPQHLLPQFRPQSRGSSAQKSLVRTKGSGVSAGFGEPSLRIPAANSAGIPAAAEPRAAGRSGAGRGLPPQQLASCSD